MIVLMFAALFGTGFTAILGWQTDMLIVALLSPLGGSFFVLGAATLLYGVRSRETGQQQETISPPPPGVVWSKAKPAGRCPHAAGPAQVPHGRCPEQIMLAYEQVEPCYPLPWVTPVQHLMVHGG